MLKYFILSLFSFFLLTTTLYAADNQTIADNLSFLVDVEENVERGGKTGLLPYVAARLVYSSMKVDSPYDSLGKFTDPVSHFGFGISTGIYKNFNVIAMRYEIDLSTVVNINSAYNTILFNIYVEPPFRNWYLIPYIMAGGGIVIYDAPFANVAGNFNAVAGAGFEVPLNDDLSLDFSYRFMYTSLDFRTNTGYDNVYNHQANVGIRYNY